MRQLVLQGDVVPAALPAFGGHRHSQIVQENERKLPRGMDVVAVTQV